MQYAVIALTLSIVGATFLQWRWKLSTQNTLGTIEAQQQKLQADFDQYKADVATGIAALLKGATILGPGQVVVNQSDLDAVSGLVSTADTDVTGADAALPGQEAPTPAAAVADQSKKAL